MSKDEVKKPNEMDTREFNSFVCKKLVSETQHKFLEGGFGPIKEEVGPIECPDVQGSIPPYLLGGEYVRTGPNPALDELIKKNNWNYHWFDGDGVVHGVYFPPEGEKPVYVSKFVESDGLKHETQSKKPSISVSNLVGNNKKQFLKEAFKGVVGGMVYKIHNRANGNTAMVYHDQRLLALSEAGLPYHLSGPNLETVGTFDYNDRHVGDTHTAHPKIDANTGEMIFFGASNEKPMAHYFVVSSDGKNHHHFPIKIRKSQMMHDFAITSKYSIIMDQPFFTSPANLFKSHIPVIYYDTEVESRFGVFPRHVKDESEIKWFSAKNGYIFHTGNAWEEGNKVYLVACRSERLDISFYKRDPSCLPKLYKYCFNLEDGTTEESVISTGDHYLEFPSINRNYQGIKNRYFFSSMLPVSDMPYLEGILKSDTETGEEKVCTFGESVYCGEAVFVPNPDGQEEDDGCLLTFICHEPTQKCHLAIINAKDMTILSKVEIPSKVPYGFHGTFVTRDELQKQRVPSPSFVNPVV